MRKLLADGLAISRRQLLVPRSSAAKVATSSALSLCSSPGVGAGAPSGRRAPDGSRAWDMYSIFHSRRLGAPLFDATVTRHVAGRKPLTADYRFHSAIGQKQGRILHPMTFRMARL